MDRAMERNGKRINLFFQDDPFSRGWQYNLNIHQTPQFNAFFDDITIRMPCKTGGRYKWVTTREGEAITELDHIQPGRDYVVSKSRSPFMYKDPAAKNRTNKSRKQETVIPILHSRQYYKQEGQAQKQNQETRAIIVHVSKSGDMMGGAKPVNIRFPSTQSFTNVLIEIAAHWTLKANKIKLYKQLDLRGTSESFVQIHEVSDLSHGDHLVAHPYPPQWQPKKYSLTCGKGFDLGHATDVLKQTKSTPMPTHFRHDQTLNKHSPLGSIQSKTGTGQSSRKTPRETDLYKDKGGVFKAKNQGHARGAKQVKDTSDTRTERPIDQRKAEIVTEEENNANKGKDKPIPKGTQVHKKPSEENGLPTEQKNTKGDKKSEENVGADAQEHHAGYDDSYEDSALGTPSYMHTNLSNNRSSTPVSKHGYDDVSEATKKEQEAASKIQAGFRGYETRKKTKALKEDQRKQEEDSQRRMEDDRREADVRQQEEEDRARQRSNKEKEEAAVKIQAGFRGFQTRKTAKQNKGQK